MTNNLHQKIVYESCKFWESQKGMSYSEFIDSLDKKQKLAVLTGNLNYQVENGGFIQWYENGYADKANELIEMISPLEDISVVKKVIALVESAIGIIEEHGELFEEAERDGDNYEAGCYLHEMIRELDSLNIKYFEINEKFMVIINEVLK